MVEALNKIYNAALSDNPDDTDLLFNKGRTAFELGRPEGETLLREYVLWDPESGWGQEAQALLGIGPD